jgi:hypothetical protein
MGFFIYICFGFCFTFTNKIVKILFLLKKNLIYGSQHSVIAKSGLLNSARITAHQLHKHLKVHTEIEICVDGNEIDKFLHKHRPQICIIEALWVTPDKLRELIRLHKRIIFVVLIHSEVPFLANEGNAISWIREYNDIERVYPAFNSEKTAEQFGELGIYDLYLPNVYHDVDKKDRHKQDNCGVVHVGAFGAIRPFKNQLIQAMAAIVFAEKNKLVLHFHMNTTRLEQAGEPVLKNIKALFEGTPHKLIEHGWMERDNFLHVVSHMDVGLQVSFSESFNIISADFVHENVPIVVSKTIDWMPESQMVGTEDMDAIVQLMERSINHRNSVVRKSIRYLNRYNKRALDAWEDAIKKLF